MQQTAYNVQQASSLPMAHATGACLALSLPTPLHNALHAEQGSSLPC